MRSAELVGDGIEKTGNVDESGSNEISFLAPGDYELGFQVPVVVGRRP
ncbi:MAG: hypothetical protein JSU87_03055 [Gemmatimonadota bacterium]|nr:MAG: hypothetical protein JSU87_03055 [Gemmatimonadota bacterium]